MAAPLVRQEFSQYSAFVGSLIESGALSQDRAAELLVEAFWECERQSAEAEGASLDAQVAAHANRFAALTGVSG